MSAPDVELGAEAQHALSSAAARLTTWLAGTVITNVYKSALMKGAHLP